MSTPTVSVIVPVYNVEAYLPSCLESLEQQTFGLDNIELILVNDGATDGSGQLCRQFASKHDNVVLIEQENKGLSGARNAGLDVATGEYLFFLDSDDMYHQKTLELCLDQFQRDPNLDIVFFTQVSSAVGNTASELPENFECTMYSGEELRRGFLETPSRFVGVTIRCVRRSVIGDLRFIPRTYFEDNPFSWALMKRIDRAMYLGLPLLVRVVRGDSITGQVRAEHNLQHIEVCENTYQDALTDPSLRESAQRYRLGFYTYRLLVIFDYDDYASMPDYAHIKQFFDETSFAHLAKYSRSKQRLIQTALFKFSPKALRVFRKTMKRVKSARRSS